MHNLETDLRKITHKNMRNITPHNYKAKTWCRRLAHQSRALPTNSIWGNMKFVDLRFQNIGSYFAYLKLKRNEEVTCYPNSYFTLLNRWFNFILKNGPTYYRIIMMEASCWLGNSVTRLGVFLRIVQPFKAGGNNYFTQIAHTVRQFL